MSRPDAIELYLYEESTVEDLVDSIVKYFTSCRGCMSQWFKINFVSPKDDRETDYTDAYFTLDESKNEKLNQAKKIIGMYHNWLNKVDPDRQEKIDLDFETVEKLRAMDWTNRPLKDSGQRRDFSTGSRRDVATGKGRYDLLPFEVMEALAKHYEKGAAKYGDDNWKKGQPLSVYLDSGLRHAFRWSYGMDDEDHLIAAIWNLIAAWWTQNAIRNGDLPEELGDAGELKKALTKKKE